LIIGAAGFGCLDGYQFPAFFGRPGEPRPLDSLVTPWRLERLYGTEPMRAH
jgi:hypothetical protein